MAVATYTKAGAKATTPAKLDKAVFDVEVKSHDLLKTAYVATLANRRGSDATTKTRGLVRGGGKKPWKQKGTGRARFGSSRNPIWRGGGIVFGPDGNENYSQKLHTKAKRQALRQALTLANKANKVHVIESFDAKDGKTSAVSKLMTKLSLAENTILLVAQKSVELEKASRNLSGLDLVNAKYLTVNQVLDANNVLVTKDALGILHEWLKPSESSKTKAKSEAK